MVLEISQEPDTNWFGFEENTLHNTNLHRHNNLTTFIFCMILCVHKKNINKILAALPIKIKIK